MPPNRTAQALHWSLFSSRIGFVFRADDSTVIRGGYGIFYLPNDVGFASGTYNSHVNTAQQYVRFAGRKHHPIRHAQHPFPTALTLPIGNDAIRMTSSKKARQAERCRAKAIPTRSSGTLMSSINSATRRPSRSLRRSQRNTPAPLQLNIDQLSPAVCSLCSAHQSLYGKVP
jgi:hypothetical protein